PAFPYTTLFRSGGPVVESGRLYRTYAIGLGEPLEAIRVIRRDGKIVYDVRPGSTILADSAAFAERFRFYTGAEDQLPDPGLEAIHGVGNTPYYRGTAYLVFPNDDLTDTQGRIPTYEVEGVTSASFLPTGVSVLTDTAACYFGAAQSLTLGAGGPWQVDFALDYSGSLSRDGIYCAAGRGTAPYLMVSKYNVQTDSFTSITPSVYPTSAVSGTSFSPDGNYLAVSFGTSLFVYKRSGDSFTKVAEATGIGDVGDCEWSADGNKIAVLLNTTSPPSRGLYVFPFNKAIDTIGSPVGLGTSLSVNPATL